MKTILSLFDHSGQWSAPYAAAGYNVIRVDIQDGTDVMTFDHLSIGPVHGILAAPPCTDFASAGARWFARKDASGSTAQSVALVRRTLQIISDLNPQWWALENPVGRIHTLVPELGSAAYRFDPCDFGEPYTKRTHLWGQFNTALPRTPVAPEGHRPGQPNAWYSKVGGTSLKTKNHRSATPAGFARAFFEVNP